MEVILFCISLQLWTLSKGYLIQNWISDQVCSCKKFVRVYFNEWYLWKDRLHTHLGSTSQPNVFSILETYDTLKLISMQAGSKWPVKPFLRGCVNTFGIELVIFRLANTIGRLVMQYINFITLAHLTINISNNQKT